MSCLHISNHLASLTVFAASLRWPHKQLIFLFCCLSSSGSTQDQHCGQWWIIWTIWADPGLRSLAALIDSKSCIISKMTVTHPVTQSVLERSGIISQQHLFPVTVIKQSLHILLCSYPSTVNFCDTQSGSCTHTLTNCIFLIPSNEVMTNHLL